MARYKHINTSPRFIAIALQKQLLPDTFEHALNHLIDKVLDLSGKIDVWTPVEPAALAGSKFFELTLSTNTQFFNAP